MVFLKNAVYLLTFHSNKHSSYSSSFPIYLFTRSTKEVLDDETERSEPSSETTQASLPKALETDEDQAIIEDVPNAEEKTPEEPAPPRMKSVVVDEWVQLNAQPPLWTRFVLHRLFFLDLLTRFSVIPKTSRRVSSPHDIQPIY